MSDPVPMSFPYTGLRLFTFPLLLLQSLQYTKNITLATVTFAIVTTTIILLC